MDYYNPNKAAWNKKPHRRPNLLNPTFASQLVTEVLTQDIYPEESRHSPRLQLADRQEALEHLKQQFETKNMPASHPVAGSTNNKQPASTPSASFRESGIRHDLLRNPLVYEYELKRAAYRASLQHHRNNSMDSRPMANLYSYNNDSAIYKKQTKDFNIISLLPEHTHDLRQFHKLTSENKMGWHLDSHYMQPQQMAAMPHNPQH